MRDKCNSEAQIKKIYQNLMGWGSCEAIDPNEITENKRRCAEAPLHFSSEASRVNSCENTPPWPQTHTHVTLHSAPGITIDRNVPAEQLCTYKSPASETTDIDYGVGPAGAAGGREE